MRYITRSVFGAALILGCAVFVFGQKELTIAEIQGDKAKTPVENQAVKTTGIVTAKNRNGYFIQTPDDKVDKNPMTSEGLYVFVGQNGSFDGAIGDLVEVSGSVAEYMPRSESFGFTNTQLTRPRARTLSSKNQLPAPITLTTLTCCLPISRRSKNMKGCASRRSRWRSRRLPAAARPMSAISTRAHRTAFSLQRSRACRGRCASRASTSFSIRPSSRGRPFGGSTPIPK